MAELEERYIVVKIKDLNEDQLRILQLSIKGYDIPTQECLVVEPDWPQYEPVKYSLLADKPTLPLSVAVFEYIEGESMEETEARLKSALKLEYERHMLQRLTLYSQQAERTREDATMYCKHPVKRQFYLAGKGDTKHRLHQCLICGDLMGY
jgi:hypothetical protein